MCCQVDSQLRARADSFNKTLSFSPKPPWEVGDIFRIFGEEYRQSHKLPLLHLKVMHAIEVCRTAYLGGHIEECNHCGYRRNAYNSCRNRHCPKCQQLRKAQWVEDRQAELLPVHYFHVVFTLPHELNPLILQNKRVLLNIFFRAVSETLLEFGRNNLGGKLGFTTILHTWDQTLLDHFHLHCLIAGGAVSFDEKRWINTARNFLFPVKALSKVFRGKFLDFLKSAYKNEQLTFCGTILSLQSKREFQKLLDQLYAKEWVVYAKESFCEPEAALEYLSQYTHRVAISNQRIKNVEGGEVAFSYQDRRDGDSRKMMTLPAEEFIRRFLLHVLPEGFMRIRHFGFLANRCKKKCLHRCRQLLGMSPPLPRPGGASLLGKAKTPQERMLELTGKDITQCPCCKKGRLIRVGKITPAFAKYHKQRPKKYWDSS